MVDRTKNTRDFIRELFSPRAATLSSEKAQYICQKNNLSFIEILQPFSRLNLEAHVRDHAGVPHPLRALRIHFIDITTLAKKPLSKKENDSKLSEVVTINEIPSAEDAEDQDNSCGILDPAKFRISTLSPWYDKYKDAFHSTLAPVDHEFTSHFLSCLFVLSADDTIEVVASLAEKHRASMVRKDLKWFNANPLVYCVVLHDVQQHSGLSSNELMTRLCDDYGNQCCHLMRVNSNSQQNNDNEANPWAQFLNKNLTDNKINEAITTSLLVEAAEEVKEVVNIAGPLSPLSESPDSPEPPTQNEIRYGAHINYEDRQRLNAFVVDYVTHGLIPWVERNLRLLNDQLSNRKTLHRSLFSATRKWFAGSTPPPVASTPSTANNVKDNKTSVVYANDAPEIQQRKLADLSFLFQHYESAYNSYHICKRDFNSDHAWLHYAAALEMASCAAFMTNSVAYPRHYMQTAIQTYQSSCRLPLLATRSTILSTEILKARGSYSEAASNFINMTIEDSDLHSALFLEQAAYCFIQMRRRQLRKFAFYMVLAGHRYNVALQKLHALRCYSESLRVFRHKGWHIAEDHINFTIGRQNLYLKRLPEAAGAFRKLLQISSSSSSPNAATAISPSSSSTSQHPPPGPPAAAAPQPPANSANNQQHSFLREYLTIVSSLHENTKEIVEFPVPTILQHETQVLVAGDSLRLTPGCVSSVTFDDPEETDTWSQLEGRLADPRKHFPSTILRYSKFTDNSKHPIVCAMNELVQVQLTLCNPIGARLTLKEAKLLWSFTDKDNKTVSNDHLPSSKCHMSDCYVNTDVCHDLVLEQYSSTKVILTYTPLAIGNLCLTGISFYLTSPYLDNSARPVYGAIKLSDPCGRRIIKKSSVIEHQPDFRLQHRVIGELPRLQVSFMNFVTALLIGEIRSITVTLNNLGPVPLFKVKLATSHPHLFVLPEVTSKADGVICDSLNAGEKRDCHMFLHANSTLGVHNVKMMFQYYNGESHKRVLRHSTSLHIHAGLQLKVAKYTKGHNLNRLVAPLHISNISSPAAEQCKLVFSVDNILCRSCEHRIQRDADETPPMKAPTAVQASTGVQAPTVVQAPTANRFSISLAIGELYMNPINVKTISPPENVKLTSFYDSEINPEQNDLITKLFRNCEDKLLTFIVCWKAVLVNSLGTTEGNYYLGYSFVSHCTNPSYNPSLPRLPKLHHSPCSLSRGSVGQSAVDTPLEVDKTPPLSYELRYNSNQQHNFRERLCLVPCVLVLHNTSEESSIQVKVQLNVNRDDNSQFPFYWIGKSNRNCLVEKRKEIKLNLCASKPGCFNLTDTLDIQVADLATTSSTTSPGDDPLKVIEGDTGEEGDKPNKQAIVHHQYTVSIRQLA